MKIERWAGARIPDERALWEKMISLGLQPYRWANAAGDVYPAHHHPFRKFIYVVRGSIVFRLPETGDEFELEAGDRMDLPQGVLHDAVVGPEGVVCLEAHFD